MKGVLMDCLGVQCDHGDCSESGSESVDNVKLKSEMKSESIRGIM